MCGLVGFWSNNSYCYSNSESLLKAMTDAIFHRGPDDYGHWSDTNCGVSLGFRRLSILDLSPAGHQPMISKSRRFVITFNGEIYNHKELRALLNIKYHWCGHSDTETLLACFEEWGVELTLQRTIGMFAIALWDQIDRILYLTRDRVGEKPLYYGWLKSQDTTSFVFGSELKSFKVFPGFINTVCGDALSQYLQFSYVPAPYSIYKNIYKLEPGTLLTINNLVPTAPNKPIRPNTQHDTLNIKRWWSLSSLLENSSINNTISPIEAKNELDNLLSKSVKGQMLSDVPVGAFLSGGIDSSTIVSLMQKQSMQKIKTFTIGFEEKAFDESLYAKSIANHLGTEHNEFILSSNDALNVINDIPTIYDEPFADSSQIPTLILSRVTKKFVSVSLSGDAGDELFGGYNRYFWGPKIWNFLKLIPYELRVLISNIIISCPPYHWDSLINSFNYLIPENKSFKRAGDKAHKLGQRLKSVKSNDDLYMSLVSEWTNLQELIAYSPFNFQLSQPISFINDPIPISRLSESTEKMMFWDTLTYLPDDILCKVDRAGMSTSLETRMPFLNQHIIEFAWTLPKKLKLNSYTGKKVLRDVLYQYVPQKLIERPKAGFGVPVGEWLKGPLKEWAELLLDKKRLDAEGYFNSSLVQQKWDEHLSGKFDHTSKLWIILMFQAWLEC